MLLWRIKGWLMRLPGAGWIARRLRGSRFRGSTQYWEERYRRGGDSGAGSAGALARFKADFLNGFVTRNGVQSVVEFGCGDGEQLALAAYPEYLGLDVSAAAVERCRARFGADSTKRFAVCDATQPCGDAPHADLAISLDVVYHLVEDAVYEAHLSGLFDSAARFVIVYSSDADESGAAAHIRHRRFTDWVAANRRDWRLVEHVANPFAREAGWIGPPAEFFVFGRQTAQVDTERN